MEQVVANIYAACLSAEAEPHADLVDLTINAVQDGLAGPNKDETLGAIFTAVQELTLERQQKGALFRIKLTAIAAAAKALPQNTRDALLRSLRAMGEVARQQALSATSSTITLLVESISKVETAVGQAAAPPAPPMVEAKAEASKAQSNAGVSLQQYLMQHARHAASDKIAFAPDIPLKKMSGALASIGGYVKAEDVVVVIDDTVFGGSKEGVFITNDRVFVKEAFTDLAIYRLESIQHIGAEGRRIFINRRQIVSMTQPDKSDVELLFSAINDYLNFSRSQPARAPAPAPSPAYASPQQPVQAEDEDGEEEGDAFHGFFYFRAAEIHLEQDADSYHERMLMVDMVNASMGLSPFLDDNGFDLSGSAEWVATTDMVHFEALLYVIELCQHLLERKVGLDEPVMTEVRNMFFRELIYPYLASSGDPHTFNHDVGIRAGLYRTAMTSNPNELPKIFELSIQRPAATKMLAPQDKADMHTALSEFAEECWNFNVANAYMRHLSERVEVALVRYANGLRAAR